MTTTSIQRSGFRGRAGVTLALVAGLAWAAPSCGTSDGGNAANDAGFGSGNGSGGAGTGAGGDDSSGVGGGFTTGTGGAGGGFEECAGETHIGTRDPLDLVIMLDQSGSMDSPIGAETLWSLTTDAIAQFVVAPEADGVGVGLQYFPLPDGPCVSCNNCFSPDVQVTSQSGACCCSSPTGQSCALADGAPCPTGGICFQGACISGGANGTCDVADYGTLEVPIDVIPNVGPAISASLAGHSPDGLTPTAPALSGAIQAAQARAAQYPDHIVAVVLATDGTPTECDPLDEASIANLAASAYQGTPQVTTFVIGLGNLSTLDAIALAGSGNTQDAFIIQPGANTTQQLVDALNAIRGELLDCQFDIPQPDMGTLDHDEVNVQYTPEGASQPTIVPRVGGLAECGSEIAWYYDDPAAPTQIVMCPAACDQLEALGDVELQIVLGCDTVVK